VVVCGRGEQRRVLQLPLTLPGMGAGIVGEKVAMLPPLLGNAVGGRSGTAVLPPLLPLVLPFPLLLPVPLVPLLPLLGVSVVGGVAGEPVLVSLPPLLPLPPSPPPHAETRRNAPAAAVASNAAFDFIRGILVRGTAPSNPRNGLSLHCDDAAV
jgi:hypothetical protein